MQNRREFGLAAAAGTLAMRELGGVRPASSRVGSSQQESKSKFDYCCFVKFIQSMSFEKMAETLSGFGYQGIEATIRPGGMILPENAKTELPKLVQALAKHDMTVMVMTSNVNRADDPNGKRLLEIASDLGIKRYRMAYYKYDLKKPIPAQVESFRGVAGELAKLNEKLRITGLYQNHAGAKNVGSTGWDVHQMLKDVDPDFLGVAFDIRHAIASGGSSWPILWSLLKPHTRTLYFKDFVWNGATAKNVALGKGVVSKKFFEEIATGDIDVPVSLHVEYLQKEGLQPNVDALKTDFETLKRLLKD